MDTSQEYIKMCEEARELQSTKQLLWGFMKLETGDYFYRDNVDEIVYIYAKQDDVDQPRIEGTVWLPRLDQLAEMWENWNHKYSFCFFADMEANSRYHPITLSNCPVGAKLSCDSLEKHVLHRIMWGKYHKIWDTEKQVWYTTEERLTPEQKAENQKKDDDFQQFIKDHPPMDTI